MARPLEPNLDLDLDLDALAMLMGSAVGELAGPLVARRLSGGRSNPTYVLSDGEREWVLRRPPHGLVLATAHDMGREVTILRALAHTGVPVPTVFVFDADGSALGAPAYVMDRIDGRAIVDTTDTARLTPGQRRDLGSAMIDTLATLHAVDPGEVGLGDWGRPEGFLGRQVRRWRRQWAAAHTAAHPEVEILLDRLEKATPIARRTGIVHGDFKLDNVLLHPADPTKIVGILDWEMSTRGETLTDLGLLLSFWDEPGGVHHPLTAGVTAMPGFQTRAELAERYAELTGADLESLDWFVVLAEVKVAILLEQIHTRHQRGLTEGADFAVGGMVELLLARALDRADATGIG
jgi:aminoglycoside phosphotransferase (APT) family kinase protein